MLSFEQVAGTHLGAASMNITIVGLKPNQEDRVETDYGDAFDLNFVASGTRAQQLRATVSSSDKVIILTKFVPHQTQEVVRGHPGLTFCNGGISAVENILEKWK